MKSGLTVTLGLALALGACTQTATAPATASAAPPCDYKSIASPPGKAWAAQQAWRYATPADAEAAYQAIALKQSPWPNWFTPGDSVLPAGTRFQMAMAPGQKDDQPGGFGTFDDIRTVQDVRDYLAVLVEWKHEVDRVITFETIKPLPVSTGPVGPQVDPKLCALLPGRWSQFQMRVPGADRIGYLKVIEVRPIK